MQIYTHVKQRKKLRMLTLTSNVCGKYQLRTNNQRAEKLANRDRPRNSPRSKIRCKKRKGPLPFQLPPNGLLGSGTPHENTD